MKRKTILYYIILIVVIGFTIRGLLLEFFSFDIVGISIILFEVFLITLILYRRSLTQVGMIGWSIIFITKNIIPLIGFILAHQHNDFENLEASVLLSKFVKIGIAVIILIVANKISFEKKRHPD